MGLALKEIGLVLWNSSCWSLLWPKMEPTLGLGLKVDKKIECPGAGQLVLRVVFEDFVGAKML